MRPIVFLDIDGVLNTHDFDREVMCGQIHADKVERLNSILRWTDAEVVLSSAWRYMVHRGECNLRGMEWLLRSHGMIAGRLIGITREDAMVRGVYEGEQASWPVTNERGEQIADWLDGNRPKGLSSYVVIDDLDLGISASGHPLVLTDRKVGLTDDHVFQALAILSGRRTHGTDGE